ncbi:uncharacterized protein LOC126758343 [Bactrocera neohumeralis]|uniref:uncharacterized protein LOC120777062 n=1 Tax=Bactrocera tryoni TaxID=59916 RepID=UPI001A96FDDA|nr:uncharacterized protein LOC120777062 [Bactrocera tryoni]XP_050328553.1 uncharacterized protein LOC126758343 [Bactrocera neohumeralis]
MRTFVVLCFVAVASAQYSYPQQGAVDLSAPIGAAQLSQPIQPVNEYNKEFYSYSAPEHEFDDAGDAGQLANSLKKNLRVVFIKGPENTGLENAALQLAKSAGDERTAIYVLSKQADIGDLANKLNSINHQTQKPEVHFVKYRTPADAENAQRAIQSQYDSLPGPSTSNNGGAAPVLNFASQAPVAPAPAPVAPANSYIPPQASYLPPGRRV